MGCFMADKDSEKMAKFEQAQTKEVEPQPKLIGEDSKKFSIINLAKKYKKSKRLIKYAGASALVVGGSAVALPFLGAVMLCGLALGAIAFIGTIAFAIYKIKSTENAGQVMDMLSKVAAKASENSPLNAADVVGATTSNAKSGPTHILWDMKGKVCVFGVEPTLQEMIIANNTENNESESMIKISNGARIEIVLNEGRDAIKIKVIGGEHNGHVGWVAGTSTMPVEKQAV